MTILIMTMIIILVITIMIDKMVSHRGKRNLSMDWVDVKKTYDHKWLNEIMELQRVPS